MPPRWPAAVANPISLFLWNVGGLGNERKRSKVRSHISQLNRDILILTETHLTPATADYATRALGAHHALHSFRTSNSRGVSVLSRREDIRLQRLDLDEERRIDFVARTTAGHSLTARTIYAPADS